MSESEIVHMRVPPPQPKKTVFTEAMEIFHRAADLIVTGTHGRRGLKRLFLGSVAQRVVALATCPVVTVRET